MDTDGRRLGSNVGHLQPGFALASGRYRIERFLGVWGIRALYAVTELPSERAAILAELALTTATDVERRARQLMRLEHPALPVLREFFEHHGFLYLVFNLADGAPLERVLASRPPQATTERQALNWGIQLADGLAFLHRQQPSIVVADLAPSAVFLTPYDRVKLVSLGVVLDLYTPADLVGVLEQGYAAPEVYMGRLDPRGDIYALGVLLYRVLSGSDPASHAPGSLPALRSLRPDVTPELAAALGRALALVPEERWPNAAAFAEALRAAEIALLAGAAAEAEAARARVVSAPFQEEPGQTDEAEAETVPQLPSVSPGATRGALSPAPEPDAAPTSALPMGEPETPAPVAPATPASALPMGEPETLSPAVSVDAMPPWFSGPMPGATGMYGTPTTEPEPQAPSAPAPPTEAPPRAPAPVAPPLPMPPASVAPPAGGDQPMMPRGGLAPQPAPSAPPAPLQMPPVVAPLPAPRKPGVFGRLFGGNRTTTTPKAAKAVDATGTVMLARHMQAERQYAAIVRIVGKPEEEVRAISFAPGAQMGKTGLGKLTSGMRTTVEVAALPPEAFHLPQPQVTLLVPQPGSLAEVRVPIVARRPSYPGGRDRLYFTFRGPDGRQLHTDPFVAEVSILAPGAADVTAPASDMLTLVHAINVLV